MTLYGSSRDPIETETALPRVPRQRAAADPVLAPPEPSGEPASEPPGEPTAARAVDEPEPPAAGEQPAPTSEPESAWEPYANPDDLDSSEISSDSLGSDSLGFDILGSDILGSDILVPWDRRPLMVVIAAAAGLVLLAVVSGVASASLFGAGVSSAVWRAAQAQPTLTPPTTAPAAPPVAANTITLSGVGDVIMGSLPGDVPPGGGAGFFNAVKDALAADLVMGNLETPLTVDTGRVKCAMVTPSPEPGNPNPQPTRVSGCHQFYLPPSYANHLRDAGFHVVSLANNHTHDMGPDGLRNTRDALDAAGIKHTGAPNQITYVDVKGIKVAVLGFAIYSWGQNLNDIPAAEELVRTADAEADLVIVQMQGGAEGSDKSHVRPGTETFLGENRGDLIKFSHAVVDAGADVIFGHGPHIMRGLEFYKGRLIAYSLGNFCGYGVLNSSGYLGVGGVLKVTLSRDGGWAGGRLVPTEMVQGGLPAPDAEKRALSFVNGLSRDDFGTSAAQISATDGAITPPPPS